LHDNRRSSPNAGYRNESGKEDFGILGQTNTVEFGLPAHASSTKFVGACAPSDSTINLDIFGANFAFLFWIV
jgi:hypothetical protein